MKILLTILKIIGMIIFAFIASFGIWYIIGFFISSDPNPFTWSMGGKIMYVGASIITLGGMIEEIINMYK